MCVFQGVARYEPAFWTVYRAGESARATIGDYRKRGAHDGTSTDRDALKTQGIYSTPLVDGPPMVEHTDQPQHLVNTAATASPEWLAVRDQYMSHLMACRACYAPIGRYCVAGAVLRTAYNSTPTEFAQ